MKLNEKIYTCRKKSGMSQDELAEKLGVSRQAISKWELGVAQPELDNLLALAKTFDVTTDWLLTDDGTDTANETPTQSAKTSSQKAENSFDPHQKISRENPNSYPDWLDRLPHTIGNVCKRFGWLIGVYISIIGSFFAGFGLLGRFITSMMFHNTTPVVKDTIESNKLIIGGDDLPPELLEELYDQFSASPGNSFYDPFGMFEQYEQEIANLAQNNPVTIICNVLIILGVVFIILGIVTAVLLRRYAKKNK